LGSGFTLDQDQALELIKIDPRNSTVVFPYLNGDDLNNKYDASASRWVIDFHDWPIERAREYAKPFSIIERKVKPFRAHNNRKTRRERWWQFAERATGLYDSIADLDRVLAITRHSKAGMPRFVTAKQVMSDATVVFVTDRPADLALLSTSIHFTWWTTKGESTLENRLRYTPSDGYETFPKPRSIEEMDQVGVALETHRNRVMEERRIGLTDVYNLINRESCHDEDIVRLRGIHVEIDKAAREAYAMDEEQESALRPFEAKIASAPLPAWRDIAFDHGFYETRQGIRYTVSALARVDILDKLLALNYYQHEQEVRQGLHSRRGVVKWNRAARGSPSAVSFLDDGGLFPPEGTLF
jgi:hypothetical protein